MCGSGSCFFCWCCVMRRVRGGSVGCFLWGFGVVGYGGLFGVEVAVVFSGAVRLGGLNGVEVAVVFCGVLVRSDMEACLG